MNTKLICVIVSVAMLNSACSTTGSRGSRAAWTGPDQVGAVDAGDLHGTWRMRTLNPVAGEADAGEITYRPDGTFLGLGEADESSGMRLKMQTSGTWASQGDNVAVELTDIKEMSGNPIAAMVMPAMRSIINRRGGVANVYEMSADRIVLVWKDGMAQELTRLK